MGFRKAQREDREVIEEISKDIWGDHQDYLPKIFDEWVKKGLYVYEDEEDIKAVSKYSKHSEKIAFLEGIRVRKEYQEEGIGDKFTKFMIDKAKREQMNKVRYTTYYENEGSISLSKKNNFNLKDSFAFIEFNNEDNPLPDKLEDSKKIEELLNSDLLETINHQKLFKKVQENLNYINYDWEFFPITKQRLRKIKTFGYQNTVFSIKVSNKRPNQEVYIPFIIENDKDELFEVINLIRNTYNDHKIRYMLDAWDNKVRHLSKKFELYGDQKESVYLFEKELNQK